MTPLVDIGIPTRSTLGAERLAFLRLAVESVRAQTFGDWRLVVSENGVEPGESFAELLMTFRDDSRIVHAPTRRDLSGAANSTLLIQSGESEFVAVLHDDDWWEPEFLERRVAFLQTHKECAYVFGGNTLVDESGREFGRSVPALAEGVHHASEYVPLLLRREGMPMPPSALVRRSAYEAVGSCFDERFPSWDYDLYLRIAVRFPVGYLNVWDSNFRVHTTQQTYRERWGERKILHEEVIDEILRNDAPHLRLPRRERLRRRSGAFMSAALDAVESGENRRALRLAVGGVRVYPPALANPRLATVLAMVLLGRRVRPALTRARTIVRRRNYLRGRKPVQDSVAGRTDADI